MKKLLVLMTVLLITLNFVCTPQQQTRDDRTAVPDGAYDIQPSAKVIELLGNEFFDSNRKKHDSRVLGAGIIAIYFSASWCPPCRAFTPNLVNAYNQIKKDGKTFELIFVSSDRSDDDMYKYMKDYNMPWYAIARDSPYVDRLMQNYTIRGIPALVIIDVDGKTLSSNGRSEVASSGKAAYDMWYQKAGF